MPAAAWLNDVRFAFRMVRREPAVSAPVIAILALSIGIATALYAVVYAMWLRPLPYPDPERLVSVTTYFAGYKLDALTSGDYGTWQGTRSLGPLAAYSTSTAAMIAPADTLEVECARISGNLFDVLRLQPALGRAIQPADDRPDAGPVAMLSQGLWRQQFGGDPRAIGRLIRLDGRAYTIIGVLPRAFRMPADPRVDVVTPLALEEASLRHGTGAAMKILHGIARLQPGITLDEARAELGIRLAASRAQDPGIYGPDVSLRIVPLHDSVVRDVRKMAMILACAVASILLIATANVAGLLVARAAGRVRETAIRVAVGASARQIARLLLVEGFTLGLIGVAAGLALARLFISLAPRIGSELLAHVEGVRIDGAVLGAAIAGGLVCSLVFSLAPVLPVSGLRLRRALVVGELALSLVLVVTASLLLKSLVILNQIAPGFRTQQLVAASVSLNGTRFADRPAELLRELSERLQRAPGIISIAFADALPPTEAARITEFSRRDRPKAHAFPRPEQVIVRRVNRAFFETMGIPLLQGRGFTQADEAGEGLVAVVNRTLATRYFAGESAIGKQVDGGSALPWKTVVGVVADTRNDGLRNPARPEIYLPLTAARPQGGGVTRNAGLNIVIRTASDAKPVSSLLRQHLRAMDRALLARVQTMDERWQDLRARPRFEAIIFAGFAGFALMMACTGIYGVLSHLVVLRRREIGVRMALGARQADIQCLVVGQAVILALAGIVIGLAGAVAAARLIASLLYQVNARDPVILASTAVLLLLLAICASLPPARRAARQDPAQILRAE